MLECIACSFFFAVLSWKLMVDFLIISMMFLMLLNFQNGAFSLKFIMIMLTFWLVMLMMMSIDKANQKFELFLIILSLLIILQFIFFFESMIMFYMFFEMSGIPMMLILFGWGYQPERIEASMYMICYTVVFSLPLLIGIYCMEFFFYKKSILYFMMFFMAFLVKFPMVGFHLWLPRAHVEAPSFGSMILAGVMLKLGGYGMIKISYFLIDLIKENSFIIIILSVGGGVLFSGICFIQSNMKMLIAYSSIVHMSIVISGILTLREMSLIGSIYMMVGHGFCSSGLFYLMGLTYNRTLSQSFFINKGFLSIIPINSLWWFMFCACNLSFPPCLNLFGEIFLLTGILVWNFYIILYLMILSFLSSLYSIYLFSFSQHGKSQFLYSYKSFSLCENMICFLHWAPLNLIIFDLSFLYI
uniref:NADH-ubiquinone oxidoreductase chain 4 n=1 Tax=Paurocephala sauteri TaxID=2768670 RepID=A0A7L9R569_9HEMI|nr:NADH dehydrogenase subunit 4 [Paurocephala sauteri]QOL10535.1 NADH dehydrogenase subunit 4 [Paurocephala sauteri]